MDGKEQKINITGDGNIVGDDDVSTVIKQTAQPAEPTPGKTATSSPWFIVISVLVSVALAFLVSVLASAWRLDTTPSLLIALGVFVLVLGLAIWIRLRQSTSGDSL